MTVEAITITTMRGYSIIHQTIERLGDGIGKTACWECGGDGDWSKFHPEPQLFPNGLKCVDCKGTGKRLLMVY